MYLSTTPEIIGHKATKHVGLVDQTVIFGTFFVKDFFASIRDVFGGRVHSYEETMEKARQEAIKEIINQASRLGANAIVGIEFDTMNMKGTMLAISARGTAIIVD